MWTYWSTFAFLWGFAKMRLYDYIADYICKYFTNIQTCIYVIENLCVCIHILKSASGGFHTCGIDKGNTLKSVHTT